ncbi:reverse transcriptase domain-containing protein [Tanacetum coccineum]
MSAAANTTPIVTTVTKTANKEKTQKERDKVNIQDFCEEHYEDILPIIMDKVRRDKRKEVHTRLDFAESSEKDARGRLGRTLELRGCGSVYTSDSQLQKLEEDANTQQQAVRVWFDGYLQRIDSYKDLKAAFLAYFMQQKKHVKDPMEIHNIKQKDEETIEEFMEHFKVETGRTKGAPECMKISGFMHGVNNPELMKRLNEHVPKTLEEMMTTNTAFIRGETATASKKKVHTPWKPQDQSKRHNSERRSDFQNQLKDGQGSSKFTPLNKTPKEIFAAESEKFKPPPPMVTPADKRSSNKFCEFHNDIGHSTDECMQLKKKIEELVNEITFPPLSANKGTEGPLVIEAEIGGHAVHRMYVDGGSSMEVLYEHCFNRLWPEIKSQMVLATTSLTGFSGETIWLLGKLRLLVTIGDARLHKSVKIYDSKSSPSPSTASLGYLGSRELKRGKQKLVKARDYAASLLTRLVDLTGHGKKANDAAEKHTRVIILDTNVEEDEEKNGPFHTTAWSLMLHKNAFVLQEPEPLPTKSVEKSLSALQNLEEMRKKSDFRWTPEAEQAFKQLKQHISELPMLVAPRPKEELIMYLSASQGAVGAVLMTERDSIQQPVLFVSRYCFARA